MSFLYNPTVLSQIDAIPDSKKEKRSALLSKLQEFKFIEYNVTIFPFRFPGTFPSEEEGREIAELCRNFPKLVRDKKVLADAACSRQVDVLLTADRDLERMVQFRDLPIMCPKRLWEYFETTQRPESR